MAIKYNILALLIAASVLSCNGLPLRRRREIIVDQNGFYLGGGSNNNLREASQLYDLGGPVVNPWINAYTQPTNRIIDTLYGLAGSALGGADDDDQSQVQQPTQQLPPQMPAPNYAPPPPAYAPPAYAPAPAYAPPVYAPPPAYPAPAPAYPTPVQYAPAPVYPAAYPAPVQYGPAPKKPALVITSTTYTEAVPARKNVYNEGDNYPRLPPPPPPKPTYYREENDAKPFTAVFFPGKATVFKLGVPADYNPNTYTV